MKLKNYGFTLVEIMIVVAIVVVLITLGVPNILRSRVTAMEGAALANLRTISTACQAYHIGYEIYPDNLLTLSTSSPPYLESVLASGRKEGYEFIYEQVTPDHFTVNANSLHTDLLRGRYFYVDEGGTITQNRNAPAGPDDEVAG